VASVVKARGMMSVKQNLLVGLGLPAFVVLFNMCFEYDNYGGLYHCWLQMDTVTLIQCTQLIRHFGIDQNVIVKTDLTRHSNLSK
jgi:hypothetical protein